MKTIYRNAEIYTVDPAMPWAKEMAVEDGKIAYIGELTENTADEVIDCGGKMIMPGFIDAHAHPGFMNKSSWHKKMRCLKPLMKCSDISENMRRHILRKKNRSSILTTI